MAIFKRIYPQDITLRPYVAYKEHNISVDDFENLGVQVFTGSFNEEGNIIPPKYPNEEGYQEYLIWKSIEHLFYSNYRNQDGIASGEYENYVEGGLSFENNSRILPRDGKNILVISIPRNLIGEGIKPAQSPGLIANLGVVEAEFSTSTSGRVLVYDPAISYIETFSNTSNETVVTHNLNTTAPFVQIYNSSFEKTRPRAIQILDSNSIKITFSTNAEVSTFKVIVGNFDSNFKYVEAITSKVQTVTHNLNTDSPLIHVYDSTNTLVIPKTIEIVDENNVLIEFSTTVNGQAIFISEPPKSIHEFENEIIAKARHGLNAKDILVQVLEYDEDSVKQIIPIEIRTVVGLADNGDGRLLQEDEYVGDIYYKHGLLVFTVDVGINYLDSIDTLNFQSTHTINVLDVSCKLLDSEYNFTNNHSITKHNSTELLDFIQSAIQSNKFTPYITTVGLYNDSNELLAVAKISPAVPKSKNTDMTINLRLDM